jgi:hypothetical protein
MKKVLKIFLILMSGIILFIIGLFIYVHIEHSGLDSVIIKASESTELDSLVNIRIDKIKGVFIDNKYSNVAFWKNDIQLACDKRQNDSILLLQYDNSIPNSLVGEILLTAKKMNKKVIIKIE